eukprot:GSChrysophyteH1.ASY1.ANO1.2942.1 assembled CDS
MFCGDEVKGCVVDLGDTQCRFGFAGQDVPRYRFRSDVGIIEGESASRKTGGYICGDQKLRYIRPDIDVAKPFTHSENGETSINWDIVERLLNYGTTAEMAVDPSEYPLLLAENYFQSTKDKNHLLEFCFESMNIPASWIANNAVMAAFSSGRTTAAVIDVGASGTRIVPVVDGYALKKATVCTTRGGNALDNLVSKALAGAGIAVRPWFEVGKAGAITPAHCSSPLREMHCRDIVRDVKKWMSFVPYMPVPPEKRHSFITEVIKLPKYELPDGTLIGHSDELCTGAEELFFGAIPGGIDKPKAGLPAHQQPLMVDSTKAGLAELLRAAVLRSDVDCRKDLLANTCLVGGCSLIDGLHQRLQLEASKIFPALLKCKVQQQMTEERLNAAWIGGSILAICGSFQQMWISKEEWLEYGDTLFAHRLH